MKQKHNAGFSLVEVLVAITVLAIIVVPTCTAMVMSFRMNNKAEDLMQAQLAVSSAVETLMAEGITGAPETYADRFEGVTVVVTPVAAEEVTPDPADPTEETTGENYLPYYTVKVTDSEELVSVETVIRESAGGGT